MGMRSTIAHVKRNGETSLVSVQWATYLDANLSFAANTAQNPVQAFKDIIITIAHIAEHISSVEYSDDNSLNNETNTEQILPDTVKNLYVTGVYNPGNPTIHDTDEDIEEFHLDDGIGAIYRDDDPGKVTFFYKDFYKETRHLTVPIETLLAYYKEFVNSDQNTPLYPIPNYNR